MVAVDPQSFFADPDPADFFNADPGLDPAIKMRCDSENFKNYLMKSLLQLTTISTEKKKKIAVKNTELVQVYFYTISIKLQ